MKTALDKTLEVIDGQDSIGHKMLAMAIIAAELHAIRDDEYAESEQHWYEMLGVELGRELTDDECSWCFMNQEAVLENFPQFESEYEGPFDGTECPNP